MKRVATSSALAFALFGCGSRTTFQAHDGPPPPPECVNDSDCADYGDRCLPVVCTAGACQDAPAVDCDDGNVCTTDVCEPATGTCSHPPATLDLDGDGHRSPLPGKRFDEPKSCGDDCDDRNAQAYPGGQEICDGVDNDCNGVVDDNAALVAVGEGVRVSETDKASVGSLAYGGNTYLATYSGLAATSSVYLARLASNGQRLASSTRFTLGPSDALDSRAVWTGDRYGVAWSDRRDAVGAAANYEVYFNLANADGTKRGPDIRLTNIEGFSINESLAWTGNQFVLAWQDDGFDALERNQIYAQRMDVNGALIGARVKLADDGGDGQTAPMVAAGPRTIAGVWTRTRAAEHDLMFAVFDHQLGMVAAPVRLTGNMAKSDAPALVFNGSEYVIAWHDDQGTKTRQIFGTVRGEGGESRVGVTQLTQSPNFARYPDLLPYGDRVLLVWSDARDDANAWEIYAKTLGSQLDPLTDEERLTFSLRSNSLFPEVAFGPNGEVGILYNDNLSGTDQVYFTRLACLPGFRGNPPPPR